MKSSFIPAGQSTSQSLHRFLNASDKYGYRTVLHGDHDGAWLHAISNITAIGTTGLLCS